jgi:hypothetical protein
LYEREHIYEKKERWHTAAAAVVVIAVAVSMM